jgi:aspartate kinase
MTNDRHSGARIIEVRPVRVEDELARGRVVIVAGFQGVSYKREITTLGRGGSDTTAVALAAALGADYCEICSDVDGVYTADPRVVDAARLLEAISYDEMLELAAHGARVLHPEAVEFARRSGIALYARATSSDGGGTRVDAIGSRSCEQAAGVTGQKNLVRVGAGAAAMGDLLALAAAATLPVFHFDCERAGGCAELWLATDDVPDWPAVRARLAAAGLEVTEGAGAASLVGDRIGTSAATLVAVREAMDGAGVAVRAIDGSPMRVTVFCDAGQVDAAVRALHQRFCARPAPGPA